MYISHNNWMFYSISNTKSNITYNDYDIYAEIIKQPFDEIKANLEASVKVIEQFLQS